jgi:myo-inositol 2-dehydrogenase/D-chiro-inositol 1-dehydrogenase
MKKEVRIGLIGAGRIGKPSWFFLERYNNAFIVEAEEFVNAVSRDTPVPVDGKDGLWT